MPIRWRHLSALWCCTAILTSASGCSLVFVRGPRPAVENAEPGAHSPPVEIPRCTESRVAPGADTALATIFALTALVGVAAWASDSGCEHEGGFMKCFGRDVGRVAAGGGGLLSVGFGASAWYGFSRTRECRNAKARALPVDGPASTLPLPPLRLSAEREPVGGRVDAGL